MDVMDKKEKILGRQYNVKINKGKTKILVCSRDDNARKQVKVNYQILEEVKEFTYLRI
jgi:hypothetical protein